MMVTIHEVDQGTPQWHELRAGKYTGSNAHKLLKFGAIDYSLTENSSFKGNYYTKRGHILESEAIELYERITHQSVRRPGFVTNSNYPDAGYSPDGLTDNQVIEVKCFNATRHQQINKDQVPLEILAQIYFGMLICEKKSGRLILYNPELIPTEALKIIDIKYSQAIQSNFKRILTTKLGAAA